MKNFLFLAIALFSIQMVSAQEVKNTSDNLLYDIKGLDVKPDFPGGRDEFYKFIAKNYRTPDVKKLNGKVYITFVIEKDGSLTEIKAIKDIGYGTGEEGVRVLGLSPKWLAGELNGQKVRCAYIIPISINSKG
jgi:Gram-negative bacterial TonB protein C-terminal